jgi:hypothetical protein
MSETPLPQLKQRQEQCEIAATTSIYLIVAFLIQSWRSLTSNAPTATTGCCVIFTFLLVKLGGGEVNGDTHCIAACFCKRFGRNGSGRDYLLIMRGCCVW